VRHEDPEDPTAREIEVRRIVDWTSGRVVTVDKAFSFTPTVGDAVHIHTKYVNSNVTHLDSSAIQQNRGYVKTAGHQLGVAP